MRFLSNILALIYYTVNEEPELRFKFIESELLPILINFIKKYDDTSTVVDILWMCDYPVPQELMKHCLDWEIKRKLLTIEEQIVLIARGLLK